MKINDIAKICHQANKAYCETIGDNSQVEWVNAPEWQRESAIKGVELHLSGDHGAEASHESWMKEKLDNGWKYGPVKDINLNEHPCLVPFKELSIAQQLKDYLFKSIVDVFKKVEENKNEN